MTGSRGIRLALAVILLIATLDVAVLLDRSGPTDPLRAPVAMPSPTPSESLDEQLARVARTVEGIRELTFPSPPEATYLTTEELAARVAALVDEYTPEQADTDRRILSSLGAIEPDYDLREGLRALLSEQVAGFYDPETGEMVVGVREQGRRLTPLEEVFLAHELQHALADAVIGLPQGATETEFGEDAALASSALVEGDASLTMQEYITVGFSALDQLRFAGETLGTLDQLGSLEQVPWVLRRSLEFPYLDGLRFVTRLRDTGGWAAVDAAYRRPPRTTAEILFPERYVAGVQPAAPPASGDPGTGWQRRTSIAFGAADLLFLFEAPGDDPDAALDEPRRRAAAWDGGTLTLWTAEERDTVAIVLVERGPPGELCDSVAAWYLRAFPDVSPAERAPGEVVAADGPRQDVAIRCDAGTVRVGIGPDLVTARAAAGA